MPNQNTFRLALMALTLPLTASLYAPNASAAQKGDGGGGGEQGAASCTYDGKTYSEGAKVYHPDGTYQLCRSDGTWLRKAPKEPVAGKAPANGVNKKQ